MTYTHEVSGYTVLSILVGDVHSRSFWLHSTLNSCRWPTLTKFLVTQYSQCMYARHSLLSVFLKALFSYASNVRYGKGTKWNKKFYNVLSTGRQYPEQITSRLCPYLPNFIKMQSNTLHDIQPTKLILDFIILLTRWHVACTSCDAHHYLVFFFHLFYFSSLTSSLPISALFYLKT